jgi:hypothetical protein
MTNRQKLEILAAEINSPCLTISFNTHRTHPDNAQDAIQLKNLLSEAESRLIKEFGKRPIASLLEKISTIESDIDSNYNLDSLHIYLSNDTKEIIRLPWPTNEDGVHISKTYNLRSLIKSCNRSEEYLILLLSQSGVSLYKAINDGITAEIRNDDFPFPENRHYNTHSDKSSDSKHLDDLVREFLNKVDKALVKVYNETGLNCIAVCTEDNYSRLQQVADNSSIYLTYSAIDYNNNDTHQVVKQSWEIIKAIQKERRSKAINEMKEAVAQGNVITDLQEIFQSSMDGRGELLIVHEDFSQAVLMTSDRTFDFVNDRTLNDTIDDITSKIAWLVLSKKGRVFFTTQDEIKEFGNIVLKTRY